MKSAKYFLAVALVAAAAACSAGVTTPELREPAAAGASLTVHAPEPAPEEPQEPSAESGTVGSGIGK